MYAYAANDPINLIDPLGLGPFQDAALSNWKWGPIGSWLSVPRTHFENAAAGAMVGAAATVGFAATGGAIGAATSCPVGGGLATTGGLAALANQLAQLNAAGGQAANFRTFAITQTAQGIPVISSGGGPLTLAQQALVQEGQLVAPYVPGIHAEMAGLQYAQQMGLTPVAQQATRIMCPGCVQAIERTGGIVAGKSAVLGK